MGRPVTMDPICKIPKCGNKSIARGLCMSHYRRVLRSEKEGAAAQMKAVDAPITEHRGLVAMAPARLTPEVAAAFEAMAKTQEISPYELTRRVIEDYVMKSMQAGLDKR